ncbi:MAG: ATP-binding protein, partial [Xanthomonadales bacterium]|jgi:two-component system sensor histidine kinase PhoQ|nr:ATP-binding protein [Xanthomonadales bacterium]
VLALGLVGLAVNDANHRGAESALQVRMESYVYTLLAAMEVDGAGGFTVEEDFADPRLLQPASGLYLQVRGKKGRWRSASALGVELPELSTIDAGLSAFERPAESRPYYIYQYGIAWQQDDGEITPFTVSVLIDAAEIGRQTSAFRTGLWRSLALAGAILALAQVIIGFLVLRPLRRVAQDVARIESGAAQRLEDQYPRELEPLARNVNRLLESEQSNQARIRNALDSLAHSLKTPLAVIQAGLPLHGGEAEASMQNAVDEMKHLVATRLERAGSSARRTMAAPIAVAAQVQRIVDSLGKVHSQKMIQAGITLEDGLLFYGEKRDLLELVGNLADNAFKYGKSRVEVSGGVFGKDGPRTGLWLRVEDDGPGMDEARQEKLLQRGVRGDERVEGHGLGLAIVMELVTAYGGEMSLGLSELGGALVEVKIPPG